MSCPNSHMQCRPPGTSKQRALLIQTLAGWGMWTSPPRGSAHPAISSRLSLSLTPPHLIEVLSVLEPPSYCSRYLLKSTNSSTSGAFYLCSGNTRVPCSLQANRERQTLPHLLQQAPPFFPIQALPFHPGYFVGICPISL